MDGRTPFVADLGGSESAMVFVARALAKRGHTVEVFTRCDAPGEFDGVEYRDVATLDAQARQRDWDVFVSLRFPDLLMKDIRARLRVLWCQDLLDGAPVDAWLAWCDALVFVSEWHRERLLARFPSIRPAAEVLPNPVDLQLVPGSREEPSRPLLVHFSRPERGLDALLSAWPSIRARAPNAELAVARYRSFYEPRGSQLEAFCLEMDRRVADAPAARHLGNLSKPELYRLMSAATAMVYPAEFDETSCIAAIESQACGLPVVACGRGALVETLAPDASILVEPGPLMRERFADAVVELLYDGAAREAMSQAGRRRALAYDVDAVAARWEEMFLSRMLRGEGGRADRAGPAFVPWPGVGGQLRAAIRARLGTDRFRVVGDGAGAWGFSGVGDAEVVLDLGLRDARDPTAWLGEIAALAGPGGRVVSVIPWAGPVASGEPDAAWVAALFGGAEEHGLSLEAAREHAVPARCWVIPWSAGRLDSAPPPRRAPRRRPRVSACLIVRDASETVWTALASLLPVADEIRVLDTGSRDGTPGVVSAFAQAHRVPVILRHAAWPDDFAEARNQSVAEAEGDWILWIDADERLVGGERLLRFLQSEVIDAYAIRQHNRIFDRGVTQIEIPFRAYRNGRGYRFYGAVHEHPERSLNETIEPWLLADGVDILHDGYLHERGRTRKLLGRNLALLNLDFEKYPGRLITEILYLRDCVNICWYDKRDRGGIREDHRRAIEAAVERFEAVHFARRDRYYHLGRKYYDQALTLLDQGVDLTLQYGPPDAPRETHRVRRVDDAAWLAAAGAASPGAGMGRVG